MVVNTGTRLFDMLNDEVMTDITFVVQGTEMKGHRVVASSQGGVLRELLENCESNRVEITQEIAPHTFKSVLQCIYTGDCEVSDLNLFELTHAASTLVLDELQGVCADAMRRKLSPTNVGAFTSQALQFNTKGHVKVCKEYFGKNTLQVFRTKEFLEMSVEVLQTLCSSEGIACSELELFQGCVEWAKNACQRQKREGTPDNLRAALGDVLNKISFSSMFKSNFEDFVVPLDILTFEEVGRIVVGWKKKDLDGIFKKDWTKCEKSTEGANIGICPIPFGTATVVTQPSASTSSNWTSFINSRGMATSAGMDWSTGSTFSQLAARFSLMPDPSSIKGTIIKFNPVTGTDTIKTRHQCISAMQKYRYRSHEELRWEDYLFNNSRPPIVPGQPFGIVNSTNTGVLGGDSSLKFEQSHDRSSGFNFGWKPSKPNVSDATSSFGTCDFGKSTAKPGFVMSSSTKPTATLNTPFGSYPAEQSTGFTFSQASSASANKPAAALDTSVGSSATTQSTGFTFGLATPEKAYSNASSTKPTATSHGLFGSSQGARSTGFSFGQTTSKPTEPDVTRSPGAQSTGFSFGQTATKATDPDVTSTKPTATLHALFGSSPGAQSTGFSFGQTATKATDPDASSAKPAAASHALFGSSTSAQGTGFSFGQTATKATDPDVSSAKPAAASHALFGSSTGAQSTGFSFGQTATKATDPDVSSAKPTAASHALFGSSPGAQSTGFSFGQIITKPNDPDASAMKPVLASDTPIDSFGFTLDRTVSKQTGFSFGQAVSKPADSDGIDTSSDISDIETEKKIEQKSNGNGEKTALAPQTHHQDKNNPDSCNTQSGNIDNGDDSDGEQVLPSDDFDFEPLVQLPEVEVETGEEDEDILFCQKAQLYRFTDCEWKERGQGDMKLLKHRNTGHLRVLMRREKVLKLCCNHRITADLGLKPLSTSDRALCWNAMDYTEPQGNHEHFAIRFKTKEKADLFKQKFLECQGMLPKGVAISDTSAEISNANSG